MITQFFKLRKSEKVADPSRVLFFLDEISVVMAKMRCNERGGSRSCILVVGHLLMRTGACSSARQCGVAGPHFLQSAFLPPRHQSLVSSIFSALLTLL
jgi:hypothetical protein